MESVDNRLQGHHTDASCLICGGSAVGELEFLQDVAKAASPHCPAAKRLRRRRDWRPIRRRDQEGACADQGTRNHTEYSRIRDDFCGKSQRVGGQYFFSFPTAQASFGIASEHLHGRSGRMHAWVWRSSAAWPLAFFRQNLSPPTVDGCICIFVIFWRVAFMSPVHGNR
jgi:hypothetical protein